MTASTTTTTTPTIITQSSNIFTFGIVDYALFILMLLISTFIGIYFGFIKKSKNTTSEYLMGSKRMKTIPIAISLVASQLSGIAIMSIPAESYSFGYNYFYSTLSVVLVVPVLCYIIVPVFYENQISNCYEYLEKRFNKRTRQLVTISFMLHSMLMLPVYMFMPSLAFSQVTGWNVHVINTVVCSICVFYTMLGGIKAVVWTDVVQAGIMLSSVLLVGILGTWKIGGLSKVLENASAGGRLDTNYSFDPRARITVWNGFGGGFFMWLGHIGLNQSCVQRIVSLPSSRKANKSLVLSGIGFIIIMGFNCFIGIVMFARYYGCDPIQSGLVEKADKLMPFFVQDILGHLSGMPGIFISCVFSASLSTMSATMNSLAGVVYFDYIKPFIRHTEARANNIMKVFVIVVGVYSVLAGFIVQHFKSILQIVVTISGITTGAVVGIFLLGMFVPRCNGKVAVISVLCSMVGMLWVILNAQAKFSTGIMNYKPLPTTTEHCENHTLNAILQTIPKKAAFTMDTFNSSTTLAFQLTPTSSSIQPTIEEPNITTAFSSNRDFSISEISFYLYKPLGMVMVWLIAIPLSFIWKPDESEKHNPHLYSPFVRRFLNTQAQTVTTALPEELPLKGVERLETNDPQSPACNQMNSKTNELP